MVKYNGMFFDRRQMEEISLGIEKNLDVSIYAQPKFDWDQMRQIRLGLEEGIDLTLYCDEEFDAFRMEKIKEETQFDKYFRLSEKIINNLKESSEENWSLYDEASISEVKMWREKAVKEAEKFRTIYNEFNDEQRELIKAGILAKYDISIYAQKYFTYEQMYQIFEGLQSKIDVSKYAKKEFNHNQMRLIKIGLEMGLNVDFYADARFSTDQMEIIKKGLQYNFDVSDYATPELSSKEMKLMLKLKINTQQKQLSPETVDNYVEEAKSEESR